MSSPNLAIPHVAAAQNQKEVTINDAIDALDRALNALLELDLSAGDVTLTAMEVRTAMAIRITGGFGAQRTLTLPALQRLLLVANGDVVNALTLVCGTTQLSLPARTARLIYLDGTVDGLQMIGESAAASGSEVYDFGVSVPEPPEANALLGKVVLPRAVTLPANLAGTAGHVETLPQAPFVLALTADGSPLGDITIGTDGSFTCTTGNGAPVVLPAGAVVRFLAPATPDTHIAGLALTLAGNVS